MRSRWFPSSSSFIRLTWSIPKPPYTPVVPCVVAIDRTALGTLVPTPNKHPKSSFRRFDTASDYRAACRLGSKRGAASLCKGPARHCERSHIKSQRLRLAGRFSRLSAKSAYFACVTQIHRSPGLSLLPKELIENMARFNMRLKLIIHEN